MRRPTRRRRHLSPGRVAGWIALITVIVGAILPLLWVLRTGLMSNSELFTGSAAPWPTDPTMINFRRVLGLATAEESRAAGGAGSSMNFAVYLRNTILFTGIVVVGQVLFSAGAGYAFARLRFPFRSALFTLFVCGLLVPPIFTVIPNFVLIKDLGLLDTMAGLVAPTVLMTPFAVFFMRQFFLGFPTALEEAARLDGLGPIAIFVRIVLPLSRAPIATLSIIVAVAQWHEYLWPLLVSQSEATRVLTVGLTTFKSQSPGTQPDWSGLMAASTLTVVPVVIVLLVFGRKMVGSIQLSGLK